MAEAETIWDAETVKELVTSGGFLEAIEARLSTAPPEPLGPVLLELCSKGGISLLDLISGDAYGALDVRRRHVVQSFFAGVLPEMVIENPAMLEFVMDLEGCPGQRVDYGGVRIALCKWLDQDPTRPADIVLLAEAGDAAAT